MNTTSETPAYDLRSALLVEAESINAKIAEERANGITLDTRLKMQAFDRYNHIPWLFDVPREEILDDEGMLLPVSNPVSRLGHAMWKTEDVKDREHHLGLYEDFDFTADFRSI